MTWGGFWEKGRSEGTRVEGAEGRWDAEKRVRIKETNTLLEDRRSRCVSGWSGSSVGIIGCRRGGPRF